LQAGRCPSWIAILHDSTRTFKRLPTRSCEESKFKKIIKRRKKEHAILKAAEKNVKNLLDYLEVILQKRHF
jgi:hypothetical protein